MPTYDVLSPGLQLVIAGTVAEWHRAGQEAWYDGAGNKFWTLLHAAGFTAELLGPDQDLRLPEFGIGLTDLIRTAPSPPGVPPEFDVAGFHSRIRRADPMVVAFVSKTAAASYARAAGQRAPRGYGALPWAVQRRAAFVLPGPSGANNAMSLPVRTAMWRDLADYLEAVDAMHR